MKSINKERFFNYAKYDITINTPFYRNYVLAILGGIVGIALAAFSMGHIIWRDCVSYSEDHSFIEPFSTEHFANITVSSFFMAGFILMVLTVSCGFWAHNMRTKQGRISELTIPATSAEKFLFHTVFMIVLTIAAVIASVFVADVVHVLLTWLMYRNEPNFHINLYTENMLNVFTLQGNLGGSNALGMVSGNIFDGMRSISDSPTLGNLFVASVKTLIFSTAFMQMSFYLFGNSVKYRYNIVLTYIAEQIISFFLLLASVASAGFINEIITLFEDMTDDEATIALIYIIFGFAALSFIISALLWWFSYKRYCNAQVTTVLNK